jgi:hypothetical protein
VSRARRLCLLAALVAPVGGAGCAAALRAPVTPFPPDVPRTVPWRMNPELLAPGTRRILFVVDLQRGHPPAREALDQLARLAARYGERPASWVAAGQPGAPRVDWLAPTRPSARAPLDPATSYVFVRYGGDDAGEGYFGSARGETSRGASVRPVYVIRVAQEHLRALAFAWLTEPRLEAQTLIHEYGHLLGLPTPGHGYFEHWPSLAGGAHCVNPDCPLTKPSVRSILYGLFRIGLTFRLLDDYCDACRADITRAKAWWRARATAGSVSRYSPGHAEERPE